MYYEPFREPFPNSTPLVSMLAREKVTVAVSGDGGDELFRGYARYHACSISTGLKKRLPAFAIRAIGAMPIRLMDAALKLSRPLVPHSLREEISADRIKKLMHHRDFSQRYRDFISQWKAPASLVLGGHQLPTAMHLPSVSPEFGQVERMMFLDTLAYLPDDILVKVDRASMSVGLEMCAAAVRPAGSSSSPSMNEPPGQGIGRRKSVLLQQGLPPHVRAPGRQTAWNVPVERRSRLAWLISL